MVPCFLLETACVRNQFSRSRREESQTLRPSGTSSRRLNTDPLFAKEYWASRLEGDLVMPTCTVCRKWPVARQVLFTSSQETLLTAETKKQEGPPGTVIKDSEVV